MMVDDESGALLIGEDSTSNRCWHLHQSSCSWSWRTTRVLVFPVAKLLSCKEDHFLEVSDHISLCPSGLIFLWLVPLQQ
jgi:hypothetical protein